MTSPNPPKEITVAEELKPQGAFWAIERSDIPLGSLPAGTTLYRSSRAGETWTDNIYHAHQFATREGAEVWHKSREASDPALRVVEHAWIATGDGWRQAYAPGSDQWWTVRRVANGDARHPWYELSREDIAALNTRSTPPVGEELREALEQCRTFAVMFLAFDGRDRGTPRMDSTLDGLVKLAVAADERARQALASKGESGRG